MFLYRGFVNKINTCHSMLCPFVFFISQERKAWTQYVQHVGMKPCYIVTTCAIRMDKTWVACTFSSLQSTSLERCPALPPTSTSGGLRQIIWSGQSMPPAVTIILTPHCARAPIAGSKDSNSLSWAAVCFNFIFRMLRRAWVLNFFHSNIEMNIN